MKTSYLLKDAAPLILQAFRQCYSVVDACAAADISTDTYYSWLDAAQNSEDVSNEIVDFYFDVIDAKAVGMNKKLDAITAPDTKTIDNGIEDYVIEETTMNHMSVGMTMLHSLDAEVGPDWEEFRDAEIDDDEMASDDNNEEKGSDYFKDQKKKTN